MNSTDFQRTMSVAVVQLEQKRIWPFETTKVALKSEQFVFLLKKLCSRSAEMKKKKKLCKLENY